MEKVDEVVKNLEKILIKKIQTLKFTAIQVVSHNIKSGYVKLSFGRINDLRKQEPEINLKKKGFRTIIPIQNNKLYNAFGAPEYLVIDKNTKGEIVQKEKIKNPYFVIGRGHGMRFARAIKANQIITCEIGANAKDGLKKLGVKIEIIEPETDLKEILSGI